ncbi:NfeD family protein [Nocardia jinanensis]|uniref:Tetratricopeptide repeat protein n=1 Tax=Nocardia jinanensis TaxID=382504 RepID=A0A917VKX9_9NOCA|nr:tetratricopeptide repeat protein [Nocardia jinanensis]GGK95621.1 hypothetical protein GCM10011588_07540 [Nocardia jinanensis]
MNENAGDPGESQPDRAVLKILVLLAALVFALGFYFLWLGRIAVELIISGGGAAIALGIGVLILPLLGVWMVGSTIRSALDHQRLARRIRDEGLELDTSDLPRRPSGRIERAAADDLFLSIKKEWEADPDNWRISYRLARAYDHAGDRSRARDTMRRAVELEKRERESGA